MTYLTQPPQGVPDRPFRPVRITLCYFILSLLWILASHSVFSMADWEKDGYFLLLFASRVFYAVVSSLVFFFFFQKIRTFPSFGKWRLTPARLAGINFLFCLSWIAFIRLVAYFTLDDPVLRANFIYISGLLLIGCTSVFLFLLIQF